MHTVRSIRAVARGGGRGRAMPPPRIPFAPPCQFSKLSKSRRSVRENVTVFSHKAILINKEIIYPMRSLAFSLISSTLLIEWSYSTYIYIVCVCVCGVCVCVCVCVCSVLTVQYKYIRVHIIRVYVFPSRKELSIQVYQLLPNYVLK